MAVGLTGMAFLSAVMRELYAKLQEPLIPLVGVTLLLVPMSIAYLRIYDRALARREAAMDAPDSQTPGWWLDMDARRLEPQHLPGQTAIGLKDEDFILAVRSGGYNHYGVWAALELRHARRGTMVELSRWRLTSASLRSAEYATDQAHGGNRQEAVEGLMQPVTVLADALAQRLSLRRQRHA